MQIKTFVSSPLETNSYVVYDEETKQALVIDAPPESYKEVTDFITLNDLKPELLILTHGHIDHIADAEPVKNTYGLKILMHEEDLFWINPPAFMLSMISGKYKPFKPDIILKGGEEIELGNMRFTIIHTPGHTPGGICVYFKSENILFPGDTIFQESIGRTDLQGGSTGTLLESITEKILTLPDETVIYPGHGDKTKIKNEKKYNPFLQNIGEE